ncbi:MAG: bifunctional ADP-dependent NAD(P)H-hydrate dehydratase/NAD(P)H-hydrate epimerase [Anaerolineales bacterium]
MPKIVSVEEMIAIEKAADAAGHSYAAMMQAAGAALAERILARIVEYGGSARVFILAGPGNNGGDGLVAGRLVKEAAPDAEVTAYCLAPRPEDDDIAAAAREAGVFMVDYANDKQNRVLKNSLSAAHVLVDALFGTGTHLPLEGDAAKLLKAVAGVVERRAADYPRALATSPTGQQSAFIETEEPARPFIIAVDCPSGLNCDTGDVDKLTLRADETVTFAAAKYGQLAFPGAAYCGDLFLAEIGIAPEQDELAAVQTALSDGASVGALLPERDANAHKGTFGKVFQVTGSANYVGASALAAEAAYAVGTGLVTVGVPQPLIAPLASQVLEATWVLLPHDLGVINKAAAQVVREECAGYDALLVGCGIGDEDETRDFMQALLQQSQEATRKPAARRIGLLRTAVEEEDEGTEETAEGGLPPLVIDADGLNVLAKLDGWPALLPPETIITPHPGEFARLAGLESAAEVQVARLALAREKAAQWNCIIVLKGAHTAVAAPDGRVTISPFAVARLATAGTGDVLAGVISGLLAGGLDPYDAAVAGVWLHGRAGAPYSNLEAPVMLARDLLWRLPDALLSAYDAAH